MFLEDEESFFRVFFSPFYPTSNRFFLMSFEYSPPAVEPNFVISFRELWLINVINISDWGDLCNFGFFLNFEEREESVWRRRRGESYVEKRKILWCHFWEVFEKQKSLNFLKKIEKSKNEDFFDNFDAISKKKFIKFSNFFVKSLKFLIKFHQKNLNGCKINFLSNFF